MHSRPRFSGLLIPIVNSRMISYHFKFMYRLNHISIRTLDDPSRIILHFGRILLYLIRLSAFRVKIFLSTSSFGSISSISRVYLSFRPRIPFFFFFVQCVFLKLIIKNCTHFLRSLKIINHPKNHAINKN